METNLNGIPVIPHPAVDLDFIPHRHLDYVWCFLQDRLNDDPLSKGWDAAASVLPTPRKQFFKFFVKFTRVTDGLVFTKTYKMNENTCPCAKQISQKIFKILFYSRCVIFIFSSDIFAYLQKDQQQRT